MEEESCLVLGTLEKATQTLEKETLKFMKEREREKNNNNKQRKILDATNTLSLSIDYP